MTIFSSVQIAYVDASLGALFSYKEPHSCHVKAIFWQSCVVILILNKYTLHYRSFENVGELENIWINIRTIECYSKLEVLRIIWITSSIIIKKLWKNVKVSSYDSDPALCFWRWTLLGFPPTATVVRSFIIPHLSVKKGLSPIRWIAAVGKLQFLAKSWSNIGNMTSILSTSEFGHLFYFFNWQKKAEPITSISFYRKNK